jgi:hypothetical protein
LSQTPSTRRRKIHQLITLKKALLIPDHPLRLRADSTRYSQRAMKNVKLPWENSFTSQDDGGLAASLGLSTKQFKALGLFSKLDLADTESDDSAYDTVLKQRESLRRKAQTQEEYLTSVLGELIPRIGTTCAKTLIGQARAEQQAARPVTAFLQFLAGLRAKFKGLQLDAFCQLIELTRKANSCTNVPFTELVATLAAVIYQHKPIDAKAGNPIRDLLGHLFQPLPEFTLEELLQKISNPASELNIGHMLFLRRFAPESGCSFPATYELADVVEATLGLSLCSDTIIYSYLLSCYEPGTVCCPAEMLLVGQLDSYTNIACTMVHVMLLASSYLQRFRPSNESLAMLHSLLEHSRTVLRLGSLFGLKCSPGFVDLTRTASLCCKEFSHSEQPCTTIDCAEMWSYSDAKDPWLRAGGSRNATISRISQSHNRLNFGGQPKGLTESDVWMTLRRSGIDNPAQLESPGESHKVLADRIDRMKAGQEDPLLKLALSVELGKDAGPTETVAGQLADLSLPDNIIQLSFDDAEGWDNWEV